MNPELPKTSDCAFGWVLVVVVVLLAGCALCFSQPMPTALAVPPQDTNDNSYVSGIVEAGWTGSGASGYILYVGTNSLTNGGQVLQKWPFSATSWARVMVDLPTNTTGYFAMKATNGTNISIWSNEVKMASTNVAKSTHSPPIENIVVCTLDRKTNFLLQVSTNLKTWSSLMTISNSQFTYVAPSPGKFFLRASRSNNPPRFTGMYAKTQQEP